MADLRARSYAPAPPPKVPHDRHEPFYARVAHICQPRQPLAPPAKNLVYPYSYDTYNPFHPGCKAQKTATKSSYHWQYSSEFDYQDFERPLHLQDAQPFRKRSAPASPPAGFDSRPSPDEFQEQQFNRGVGGCWRHDDEFRTGGYHHGVGERK